MRIANVNDRLKLLVDGAALDVHAASRGRFGPDPQRALDDFDALRDWASTLDASADCPPGTVPFDPTTAGPPAPRPRQVFAIGLNYGDHAKETGRDAPADPVVFTKYVSSFSGPAGEVRLPAGSVDWEVELVAVMSRTARAVRGSEAWAHVAGLMVGQDLSERQLQRRGPAPQFALAKSFPRFSPMGPALVTPDELDDADDLGIGCTVNGEEVQKARTSEMLFSVPELVAYLSSIVTLYPGDLIYTGTPPGVGMGRTPPRFLAPGDHLHSWVDGIGVLDQRFVAGD